jgi:hypothetical protein
MTTDCPQSAVRRRGIAADLTRRDRAGCNARARYPRHDDAMMASLGVDDSERDLVVPYLRFHEVESGQADEEAQRAATRIDVMVTMGRPEEAWPVIVAAIEMTDDEDTLANLGAGDLESLIVGHGPAFIARIEEQAQQSSRFRRALRNVWASSSTVWPRVEAAAGDVP